MSPSFFRQIMQIRPSAAPVRQPFMGSYQRPTDMIFSAQVGRHLSIVLMILVMLIVLLGTQLSVPAHASDPAVPVARQLQAGPAME